MLLEEVFGSEVPAVKQRLQAKFWVVHTLFLSGFRGVIYSLGSNATFVCFFESVPAK